MILLLKIYVSNINEKFFLFDNLKNKIKFKNYWKGKFKKLILAPYDNYVVQKALIYSNNQQQYEMLNEISYLVNELKSINFGIKLYKKMTIKYPVLLNIIHSNENYFYNYWINNSFFLILEVYSFKLYDFKIV